MRLLLFLLCNVITILSMDLPLLPFNPLDNIKPFDFIEKNDLVGLESMLATFGMQAFPHGIHHAAQYGRVDCIKIFLKYGANLNSTTKKGDTLLHHAKTVKVAEYLLDNDAGVDEKNEKGKTPLYKALFCHRRIYSDYPYKSQGMDIAQLLLNNNADINCIDTKGNSLLHAAVEKKNIEAAKFLLDKGINIITNHKGLTAFDLVVEGFNSAMLSTTEFFDIFEKHGMLFFPRMKIADLSNESLCKQITKENIFNIPDWIDFDNRARLSVYAYSYHNKVRHCSKMGIFFDRNGCIVHNVSPEHLQDLFTPEVLKKNSKNIRFLRKEMAEAFNENNQFYFKKLLECFPWLAHDNRRLTYWMIKEAIEQNYTKCLRAMLKTKVDLSLLTKYDDRIDKGCMLDVGYWGLCVDRSDKMPFLHVAVLRGNEKAIRLLVEYGADCLQRNSKEQTPLQYAIELGREKCAHVLNLLMCKLCASAYQDREYRKSKRYLNNIINVNVPFDKEDNTLLHAVIAEKNHKKSIQFLPLLIAKGVDVNRRNSKGYMSLNFLNENNNNEALAVFKMLLKEGADIRHLGDALLTLALLTKKDEYSRLFLKYGAIVHKEHLEIEASPEITALLKQKYKEQQCCVCLDNPGDLACISCSSKHSEFLCQECNGKLNVCPLCRGVLLK